MTRYRAPLDEFRFLIEDVIPSLISSSNASAWSAGQPVLESAARVCENVLAPLNRDGDECGCRYEAGRVTTPPGFVAAFEVVRDCGWLSASEEGEDATLSTPSALCFDEMLASANVAFSNYLGPTKRVVQALRNLADPQLLATYLPPLLSGECGGTLCLTEPHCGTDLGLINTRAEPTGTPGEYAISGSKIFVTSGEHDLTDNIVHLVLARIAGAPGGVKGLTLFLVPKLLPAADTKTMARNGVLCTGIEHKMGIKASATCTLRFEKALGTLLGAPGGGLRAIFSIMERERLTIATQSVGLAEHALQKARAYARERMQGRAASRPPASHLPADPIIAHADVRRMLLTMKAYTEGARALLLWTAQLIDDGRLAADEARRSDSHEVAQLLTPVAKAFITDICTEATSLGIQIMGGHGYIRESGMEQLYRDARVTQLYAGANGIQALDLVARKLPARDGHAFERLMQWIEESLAARPANAELDPLVQSVRDGADKLRAATRILLEGIPRDADLAGSVGYAYLQLFGHVALGAMWVHMAHAAQEHADDGVYSREFCAAKMATAHFYAQHLMPVIERCVASIRAGSSATMRLDAEAF